MESLRAPARRIHPLTRRLRPPSCFARTPRPRYFTHNGRFLLVASPGIPRPHLPFLHAPCKRHTQPSQRGGQWQGARHISTENKAWLKQQVKLGFKYGVYGWAMIACLLVMQFGFEHEVMERKYPSPPEWKFMTRVHFRKAKAEEDPENEPNRIIDWAMTSSIYELVLGRLEDLSDQGKGLLEQERGGILVEGAGQMGFDITAKSENWRRGYWEVLMGCGRCAQHLDGWVKDVTRNISFPIEHMIGPSNPSPRPVGPNSYPAPLEENCVESFHSPETFYLKIITTRGFTTGQRTEAALAYADWLSFKGLTNSAEEVYRWALDIATSGVTDGDAIIDKSTGILRETAPMVTRNIIQAATSLATHFAQQGNVNAALPIYLSVLRARRAALPAKFTSPSEVKDAQLGTIANILSIIRSPDYPSPPPTGDEVLIRDQGSQCDDAILMAYIGEVLFASSPSQRNAAIRWTRDAVDLAEQLTHDANAEAEIRRKCRDCAEMGLFNWVTMVRRLVREGKQSEQEGGQQLTRPGWTSWIGWGGVPSSEPRTDWEEEERQVEGKLAIYREQSLKEQYGNGGVGDMVLPGFGGR